jgi:hypothetical protein
MAEEQEQSWANELRGQKTGSQNPGEGDLPEEGGEGGAPAEEAPEEAPREEAPEKVEGPESEQKAKTALFSKRWLAIKAQKSQAKVLQGLGWGQRIFSQICGRSGTCLVSFGLGLTLSLVGVIFAIPLLIVGVVLIVVGFGATLTAEGTMAAAGLIEKRADAEEERLRKESGGVFGGARRAARRAVPAAKFVGAMLSVLLYVFSTILGLVGGLIFLAIIVGGVIGAAVGD